MSGRAGPYCCPPVPAGASVAMGAASLVQRPRCCRRLLRRRGRWGNLDERVGRGKTGDGSGVTGPAPAGHVARGAGQILPTPAPAVTDALTLDADWAV
ncbi:hypothetical protein GCM10010358_33080 [Streptomyces minutiscleroticus]|uniref:Uncharacterized protein n=1 Tax=Streptomyces minutiscleroticus TaxID=68238 RepID=A0A918NKN1_9ACTN|nr:hypothetical protein GCM10010358_33080 [Streptomyces minutiscleroticus]